MINFITSERFMLILLEGCSLIVVQTFAHAKTVDVAKAKLFLMEPQKRLGNAIVALPVTG